MALRQLAKKWGIGFDGYKTWTTPGAAKKCSAYVGVRCDSSGRVVSLTLPVSAAEGPITGISKLTALTKISMPYNIITGSIADVTKLPNLRFLDLSRNIKIGKLPASLTAMTALKHLDLTGCRIGGVIPAFLGESNPSPYCALR
ncbi:unnamed protein product [Closterium sp. Yama58-4]|nr:unnamed protein product [Closterium sp. Yama58-4]